MNPEQRVAALRLADERRDADPDDLYDWSLAAEIMLRELAAATPRQPNPNPKYWLCCGRLEYLGHADHRCIEAAAGHSEHVRYGTREEHAKWSIASMAQRRAPVLPTYEWRNHEGEAWRACCKAFYDAVQKRDIVGVQVRVHNTPSC